MFFKPDEHIDGLFSYALVLTRNRSDAEDLVQECLLKLAQRWRHVSKMDQPLAYARQVLVNLAARGSKKHLRRRAELGTEPTESAAISDSLELLGVREELLSAMRQLTVRQRTVLALRYFHDLSETQVAQTLGCSIGTVRSTTSRSLAQLRHGVESAAATRSDPE